MDSSVKPDIPDVELATPRSAGSDARRVEPSSTRSFRRFGVDPASSPLLMAAFAWDTPGAHD